jgi:uncharacterized protein YbcV (DUF1398 family)
MSKATANLEAAQRRAMATRPKVGGFPHLADTLRRAGVTSSSWFLPACSAVYLTDDGPVVIQGAPLVSGAVDIATFNQAALIKALRTDQAGQSSFPEFLAACWSAGIVRYDIDFIARTVSYFGCRRESYIEQYPAVAG